MTEGYPLPDLHKHVPLAVEFRPAAKIWVARGTGGPHFVLSSGFARTFGDISPAMPQEQSMLSRELREALLVGLQRIPCRAITEREIGACH